MTHASYTVSEETTSGNFTLPDRVNVTYTCNEGYTLLYPQNFTVGCEYITTPRGEHNHVLAKAVWKSPDGIICKLGQYMDGTHCNQIQVFLQSNAVPFGSQYILSSDLLVMIVIKKKAFVKAA